MVIFFLISLRHIFSIILMGNILAIVEFKVQVNSLCELKGLIQIQCTYVASSNLFLCFLCKQYGKDS